MDEYQDDYRRRAGRPSSNHAHHHGDDKNDGHVPLHNSDFASRPGTHGIPTISRDDYKPFADPTWARQGPFARFYLARSFVKDDLNARGEPEVVDSHSQPKAPPPSLKRMGARRREESEERDDNDYFSPNVSGDEGDFLLPVGIRDGEASPQRRCGCLWPTFGPLSMSQQVWISACSSATNFTSPETVLDEDLPFVALSCLGALGANHNTEEPQEAGAPLS